MVEVSIDPREKLGFALRPKSVIAMDIVQGGQGDRIGVLENDIVAAVNGEAVDGGGGHGGRDLGRRGGHEEVP